MSDSHLKTILNELQKINSEAGQLVAGLTEEQVNWIPEPGAWSMALCLDHLAVTNREFRPYLEKALAKAKQRGLSNQPYRPTWMGKWLIKTLNQEGGRKFKAPKNFQPPPQPAPGALERFLVEQRQVASLIERSRGSDTSVTLRSPVTPLMRYSLGDAFEVIVAHDRRHLRQAHRVKDRRDFPHSAN